MLFIKNKYFFLFLMFILLVSCRSLQIKMPKYQGGLSSFYLVELRSKPLIVNDNNNTVPLFLKENKYYCLLLFEYKKIELIRKAYIDYGNNLNIPSYNKYDSITKAIATDLNFKLNDSILINKCLIMVKNKSQLRKIMQLNKIIIEGGF